MKVTEVQDDNDLTFSGGKNSCEDDHSQNRHDRSTFADVPFASLGTCLLVFPCAKDELDFTRCVKTAAANCDIDFMFRRDFDWLTRFLGGYHAIKRSYQDR